MSNNHKIKILLVGSVGDHWEVLHRKLSSLQSSKAGPFDACFCVGSITFPKLEGELDNLEDFPLPVYLQEFSGGAKPAPGSDTGGIAPLGHNLFYLQGDKTKRDQGVQILELKLPNQEYELVIGCCSKHVRVSLDHAKSDGTQQHQQCDIMLSSDWPQGMEDVVNVDTEPLSYDVAQMVLECRPRYHVAPSTQQFHQSPPYALPKSEHIGRFLALAPVTTEKPTKSTKFIHALGLVPLAARPPPTTAPSTLPCPFLSQPGSTATTNGTHVPGFAKAAANQADGGNFRFATNNKRQRRPRDEERDDDEPLSLDPPDDPSIQTLFLYGLHKDVTGQLSDTSSGSVSGPIFNAFCRFEVTEVRYPPNAGHTSTFCFLEFPTQKHAHDCLVDCNGRINIDGVPLTLKWATPNNNKRTRRDPQDNRVHYVTQAEAADSITLYFHPPKGTENSEEFATTLCQYLQQTLEDALNDGNTEERVTAETEPALKVTLRNKDTYGFFEFASHAAATMALAAVTQSTDGGLVVAKEGKEENDAKSSSPASIVESTLRWAKGAPKKSERQEILEALGGLERHYYAKDNRTDCWFCLASPTCETHLITGVYQDWYATMPKGPVHPGHVLLVPVTHTRQGMWTLPASTRQEWTALVTQLQQHASQAYDCDLFVFERAMATKGGYHSHINCVPIPRKDATTLQTTMMAHAKASGFELRPIQSDLGVQSLLDGDSEAQYFYAEIRTRRQSDRFLYHHDSDATTGASVVPLQFAREVLAAVLKNPKLAHWKSCLVDQEQEKQLAQDLRESFTTTASMAAAAVAPETSN